MTRTSPLEPAGEPVPPTLGIFSDTICPWCYVGKRRVERALTELAADGLALTVRWRPFELNPGMPPGGADREAYRAAKFGGRERSQALDARVAAAGAEDGIVFRHDRIARSPNTRSSHRLVWLAGAEGGPDLQGRVVEELFAAYFVEGQDIGDADILAGIGERCGIGADRVAALLQGQEGVEAVVREERWAQAAGLTGVPTVLLDDLVLFSGAQPVPVIVAALREAGQLAAGGAGRAAGPRR
jgi:predicted DsbA family dithiol-disulfide isomerase